MKPILWLRGLLHRRYSRALAVGFAIAAILCSLGALRLRLEHDVSLMALGRYFTRSHFEEADLTKWLRNWEAGLQLDAMLATGDTRFVCGMVYANRGRLVFHPHVDRRLRREWRTEWENRTVYSRLVPLYHKAAVAELIDALSSREMRAPLTRRGLDLEALAELETQLAGIASEEEEIRLLRRAGVFIQPFTPSALTPSWLALGDRLRFYESSAPEGDFVGQFAVLDPGWGSRFDEREARQLGRRNHYILITRVGPRILLLDFYRDQVRRYDLTPFDHLSGSRLYRLTVAG